MFEPVIRSLYEPMPSNRDLERMDWTWLDKKDKKKKEVEDKSTNVEIMIKRGDSLLFEVDKTQLQSALELGYDKIDALEKAIIPEIDPKTTIGER